MCASFVMCLSFTSEIESTEEQRKKTMIATTTEEPTTSRVRRSEIVPCLSCPLCHELFRDATTVSECLHTFCKECLWKKFNDEGETHCPVCNKYLGCYPLDRTRPDHSLQDLRDKIFPNEGKSAKVSESVPVPISELESVPLSITEPELELESEPVLVPVPVLVSEPEFVPSIPLPTNFKKEKPLTSLGSGSTQLSSHSCLVERRAKTAAKKFLNEQEYALAAFQLEKKSAGKKHGRLNNGVVIREGSPKNLSRTKSVARKKTIPKEYIPSSSQPQPLKVAEDNKTDQEHNPIPKEYIHSTSQPQPLKVAGDHNKTDQENSELVTENGTSEIENRKTPFEPDLSQPIVPNEAPDKNAPLWKGKAPMWEPLNYLMEAAENAKSMESNNMQENANDAVPVESCNNGFNNPIKIVAASDQIEATPVQPNPIKTKGSWNKQKRKVKFAHDLNVPAEPLPDGLSIQCNERITPIWISLVASEEGDIRARLPQIPSRFIRIRDVNVPVEFIKKYVAKKLGLASEAEVEISLMGKPLLPSLQLKDVAAMWLDTVPKSKMIHSFVGDSAEDFVMVLSYGRKAIRPTIH